MTDYAALIEPLFSCSEEGCREECSYPASLLAIGPHGPICEGCYDEKCWNGTKPEWSVLPAFVPAYVTAIATLTAERDALRAEVGVWKLAAGEARHTLDRIFGIASTALKDTQ